MIELRRGESGEEQKQRVRRLVQEIGELVHRALDGEVFWSEFIAKVEQALGAVKGEVWIGDRCEVGAGELAGQQLAARVYQAGKIQWEGNWLGCPVLESGAVVVVKFEGQLSETAREGLAKFLEQLSGYATAFLKKQGGEEKSRLLGQVELFNREVHKSLQASKVAYCAANEGRLILEVDRLSVLMKRGERWKVEAVSGVASVERRAESVKRAEKLVRCVLATGEGLIYEGAEEGLPPQISGALHEYLDETHARSLAIVPLIRMPESTDDTGGTPATGEAIGALVAECFEAGHLPAGFALRSEVIAEHAATALGHAAEVESLWLWPVWKKLGRIRAYLGQKKWATGAVVALVLVGLGLLVAWPADFELTGPGTLEPQQRGEVFARGAGVVEEIRVDHSDNVKQGQVIIVLKNAEFELELQEVVGKRLETEKNIDAVEATLVDRLLPLDQRSRLSEELNSLESTLTSLSTQEKLLRLQLADLQTPSPMTGQVITWDARRRLLARPVERGEVLLSVADLQGPWVLDLNIPEQRMGHIAQAFAEAQQQGQPLTVRFIPATDPNLELTAQVEKIAQRAEVEETQGNCVRLIASFDRRQLHPSLLRPGAAVTARIHCGKRPLGYVWLHELWEWVQREILFRFS